MTNSMITRSSLVDKLRDYQIRSHHKWSILGLFSHQPFISTWAEVVVAMIWAFIFIMFLVSSYVAFYLRHQWISLTIFCIGILIPIRLRAARKYIARRGDRRMQIPIHVNALNNFCTFNRVSGNSHLQYG